MSPDFRSKFISWHFCHCKSINSDWTFSWVWWLFFMENFDLFTKNENILPSVLQDMSSGCFDHDESNKAILISTWFIVCSRGFIVTKVERTIGLSGSNIIRIEKGIVLFDSPWKMSWWLDISIFQKSLSKLSTFHNTYVTTF